MDADGRPVTGPVRGRCQYRGSAVERQSAAVRELSRWAFPEPDVVPDDAPASIEQARA